MKRAAFDEMRALEDGHWWFRARRDAIAAHVDRALARPQPGAVLDVGCGTGANLVWLSRRAPSARLVGVEFDAHALELARGRQLGVPLVQADATHLPFPPASASCVVCCDVLEHIEDDAAACRELARVLIPGGILVATVPACPSLWSLHDQAASHRRRYSGGELEQRLREAGFAIEASHGFNLASWPLVWAIRRWRWHSSSAAERAAPTSDFRTLPAPLNACLVGWLAFESALLRTTGIRAGVSLVIRARRA
ncbi:MAG TPA: class I SAM-dependent methyltransferase [Planctomycetota bacterium]|nr:class I SAM-dependent methyltransferase [Planctomycetota bacterium]